MTKEKLINRTVEALEKLPEDKIHQIADFADFVLKKYEEQTLQKGIEVLVSKSDSFSFLHDDEEALGDSKEVEISSFVKSMSSGKSLSADLDHKAEYLQHLKEKHQ